MNNFKYKNPTKIIFGQGEIKQLAKEVPSSARVIMLYGGGSIKKNGVYQEVKEALKEHTLFEFGGIPSNPEYEKLLEAVKVIKQEKLDYILAVGGGSVIDGAKFISAATMYQGDDAWDLLAKQAKVESALPIAAVLTLPATGSEMNSGAVVSRRETKEKLSFGSPLLFPQVSILDPRVIASLPKRQIANGVVDAFMHTLEQYLTYPVDALIQDRYAEGILQTLLEVGKRVLDNPSDLSLASNFMWACTQALNGLIGLGVPKDWGVHAIGHELTALFGIDHARTLAIIAPRYYEYCFEQKKEKLVQYAERVWGVKEGSAEERAKKAIALTEDFFHSLGVDTKLAQYTDDYEGTAEEIARRFNERAWVGIGETRSVTPEDVALIIKQSYK